MAILDSSTLQPQVEGINRVVRLFQKVSAKAQLSNPCNTEFATGVDLDPYRGHFRMPPTPLTIYKGTQEASVSVESRE